MFVGLAYVHMSSATDDGFTLAQKVAMGAAGLLGVFFLLMCFVYVSVCLHDKRRNSEPHASDAQQPLTSTKV